MEGAAEEERVGEMERVADLSVMRLISARRVWHSCTFWV